jgi:uncharacterized protein (DUF1684 family)
MNISNSILKSTTTVLVIAICASFVSAGDASYQQSVEKWRQDYQQKLTSDTGWLTVSGLFWLREGKNTFGSGTGNDIVLPAEVPASAGYFDFHAGTTVVHVNPGVPITLNGSPIETAELVPDSQKHRLVIGDLMFYVHASGERFAVRLKDKNSKLRKDFAGLHWYPVNETYRVTAKYVLYPAPRKAEIETVLGDHEHLMLAGYATFQLNGQEYRLEAEQDGFGRLFIVFRDLTSARETYQAARFLDTDPPKDGSVVLDFNEAYNPPCAYNPYTTCPLPAPGNRLRVEIPAGEKRYHN